MFGQDSEDLTRRRRYAIGEQEARRADAGVESYWLVVDSKRSEIAGQAFAVDLSQLGARIRTQARLEIGQRVTVIPREGKAFAVPSCVVWVNAQASEEGPEAGLAFLQPQPADSSLLDAAL